MQVADSYCEDVLSRLIAEIGVLMGFTKRVTVSVREVEFAARLCLPKELAKLAVVEGTRAVTKYLGPAAAEDSSVALQARCSTQTTKVGLTFPVGRVHRALAKKLRMKVAATAPVYLAAVLEFMVRELMELAGYAARYSSIKRITPRYLFLAIFNDEELARFASDVCIPFGGVTPNIHASLIRGFFSDSQVDVILDMTEAQFQDCQAGAPLPTLIRQATGPLPDISCLP